MHIPAELSERFVHSARPMVLLLAFFGITDLKDLRHISPRFIRYAKLGWCTFWLLLHFQSWLYIFFYRTMRRLVPSFSIKDEDSDGFIHALFRLNPMIFGGPLVHLFLVLTFRFTTQSFLDRLEALDLTLGRPTLSHILQLSNKAVLCILFTVNIAVSLRKFVMTLHIIESFLSVLADGPLELLPLLGPVSSRSRCKRRRIG